MEVIGVTVLDQNIENKSPKLGNFFVGKLFGLVEYCAPCLSGAVLLLLDPAMTCWRGKPTACTLGGSVAADF